MSGATTLRINTITGTGAQVLGTSYNTTDVVSLDMASTQPYQPSKLQFSNVIDALYVKLTSVAGGATKVTIKVCLDAAGDLCIIPSTEATIEPGITTAGTGCVVYSVGVALAQTQGDATLYVFAKLDAGTATFAEVTATWRE